MDIYNISETCVNSKSYCQILDEVPITNWGRVYVCGVFTLYVVWKRPWLVLKISKYWAERLILR